MNRDIVAGKWQQLRGKVKEEWGKLTDDDLTMTEGKFDKLSGVIRERYGYTREKAEDEFETYRGKRDFARTPEPRGSRARRSHEPKRIS